jgi:hypothetical protein
MVASPFYHQLHIVQLRVLHRLTGEDKFAQVAHPALARSRGKNRNRRKRRRDRSLRTPPHLQPTTHCDKNSTPKENSWFATSAPWAWLTDQKPFWTPPANCNAKTPTRTFFWWAKAQKKSAAARTIHEAPA